MNQYLILHKVRGEPSLDIAEKTMIGDEEAWILSTCGHRAYPYWFKPVSEIPDMPFIDCPDGWPDHYQPKAEPKVSIDIGSILSSLVNFKRRM
jgi:hypothetical protein